MSRPPRRKRIFWRIYLHGLAMVVVVTAVGVAVLMTLWIGPAWHHLPDRLAKTLATAHGALPADREALAGRLDELHRLLELDLAVYRRDGTRLASAGESPPPPLPADEARSLRETRRRVTLSGLVSAVPLDMARADSAYLVVGPLAPRGPTGAVVLLLAALLVLGLVSIPLARAIARPLEQITHTARELGRGKLSARTGLDRGDEVGELARTLDEMAGELERRVQSEKELLASLSHEIRTPLSRIRVALELCGLEGETLQSVRAQLEGIEQDVVALDRLLGDALTAARLDGVSSASSVFVPKVTPVALVELAGAAAERFRVQHGALDLETDFAEGMAPFPGDEGLLRRVLDNLLDNAAKYGGEDAPVELFVGSAVGRFVIEVRDRGVGIGAVDRERIFTPFYRAPSGAGSQADGSGLGLALCRRIVQAHGGEITATPRDGGGTVFRVSLPRN